MMPIVPQLVPVEKPRKQATRNMSIGMNAARELLAAKTVLTNVAMSS